jgi:hypothetical protein
MKPLKSVSFTFVPSDELAQRLSGNAGNVYGQASAFDAVITGLRLLESRINSP